ncbi:PHD finger-like protein [Melia azedarach]|uniref:PHD finger-like protein n=1 Tax=Melia azedarach TaxID=155640 RepID=A0ACC1XRH8_MELAZ|nr:PHD finger-like protein [Melia azedarach]
MESNICDINHLDADVLLPPRKRLLAGFKKQSSDVNGSDDVALHPPAAAASSSPSSPSSNEFSARLNNLLKSTENNSNLSPEEIAELAESAAITAVKAAEDARAAAEKKAVIATRAITAAKSALDLVANFNEEAASRERYLKKNKLKKHVPVQLLYKKQQSMESNKTDEELARKLHRVMNSSPRISKNLTASDLKGHRHKKLKSSLTSEKIRVSNGGIVLGGNLACTSGHAVLAELDSEIERTFREVYPVKADERTSKYEKAGQQEMDNEGPEAGHLKEKALEGTSFPGRKRGRLKLKKLPLSICTLRDRVNPKEEMITRTSPLTDKNMGNPPTSGNSMPLFSLEPSSDGVIPIEATPTWKCQQFKAPTCVKQNKVVQS